MISVWMGKFVVCQAVQVATIEEVSDSDVGTVQSLIPTLWVGERTPGCKTGIVCYVRGERMVLSKTY